MEEKVEEKFKETSIIPIFIQDIYEIENQMINSICKIHLNDNTKGTGFLCKIPKNDKEKYYYMLITNNHILNEKYLKENELLKFLFIMKRNL